MSVKVITHVWDNYKQGGSKKLLMVAIADACNDFGECYPGLARLAEKCCLTVRYVQKLLRELEKEGEIRTKTHGGTDTKHGKTNRYYMVKFRQENGIEELERHELSDTPSEEGVNHRTPQDMNHSSPQGVNHRTPKPSVEPSVEPLTIAPGASVSDEKPQAQSEACPEYLSIVDKKLKAVMSALEEEMVLTPSLLELLKSDLDDYTEQDWIDGIEITRRAIMDVHKSVPKPYNYLVGVLKNRKQEVSDAKRKADEAAERSWQRTIEMTNELERRVEELKALRKAEAEKEAQEQEANDDTESRIA